MSLPAMGVFAFLLFFAGALPLLGRQDDRRATLFLVLATSLPVLTSLGMGYLSLVTLDAVCKLCIGIYAASLLAFVGALAQWRRARVTLVPEDKKPLPLSRLGLAFGLGVAFVALPAGVYASSAPDFTRYAGACGELTEMPSEGMLVALGPQTEELHVVEVFDPLCPACRGFEERFGAQAGSQEVSRQVLLFPLDNECNWMVDDAIHAGACAISEAILCADVTPSASVQAVVDWAFAEQETIREASEEDPAAAAALAKAEFPALADCLGGPRVRARLNMGLRFAVENQMPIVTPQLFVNGVRMCDEDTDLGMDFILRRLIDKAHADGIRPPGPVQEALAIPAPPVPTPRRRGAIQLRPSPARDEVVEPDAPAPDALAELAAAAAALETGESEAGEEVPEAPEVPEPVEPVVEIPPEANPETPVEGDPQ